jgi:hypothetical protein
MCYSVTSRRFIFSPEGSFFRTFLLDEVVKSIDALSREQLVLLVQRLGLSGVRLPVLLPGGFGALIYRVEGEGGGKSNKLLV